jgi:CheY-like chemotaxis protein
MKILVVDDNESITSSLSKYLQIKKHSITTCNNGKEGLELIKNQDWDTILLDLSMPEFSGLDIIEDLEKNKMLNKKNIVLFTTSSIPDQMIENLIKKEGIKTCLKKPLPLAKIVEIIAC